MSWNRWFVPVESFFSAKGAEYFEGIRIYVDGKTFARNKTMSWSRSDTYVEVAPFHLRSLTHTRWAGLET